MSSHFVLPRVASCCLAFSPAALPSEPQRPLWLLQPRALEDLPRERDPESVPGEVRREGCPRVAPHLDQLAKPLSWPR